MEPDLHTVVAVRPAAALAARPRLFRALAAAFRVRFEPWAPGVPAGAVITFAEPGAPAVDAGRGRGVPSLTLLDGQPADAGTANVRLHHEAGVDGRLRGVVLGDHPVGRPLAAEGSAERVLATAGPGPVWVRAEAGARADRVAATLPELASGMVLRDALDPRRALALVAVVELLRSVTADAMPRPPRLRATILFDDPNLRWPSYGFIDYRRLIEHADAHGYHAAMATIPLDARRPHPRAVAMFKARPDRLSLVFHGNNHVKRELMEPSERHALALTAQALRRIEGFEARSGLHVDRVMTPPHGMCSADVARSLGLLGFDALCAIHPLPWTEHPPSDRLLAGWDPAEFAGPCAVIPRFTMDATAAEIALRAYLGHPLVVYGHHEDVADGLDPLAEIAERVNRVGDVEWTSLGTIAAGNHALAMGDDGAARLRPYTGRARLTLPVAARTLAIEGPRDAAGAFTGWSDGDAAVPFGVPVPCTGGATVELKLCAAGARDPRSVAVPAAKPWPVLRRAGTEVRDRIRPFGHRPTDRMLARRSGR